MARLAAYLGPSIPVARLLEDGTFALVRQASAAHDGFGVGWYPEDGRVEPVRLLRKEALGAEKTTLELLRRMTSGAIVAGLRRSDQAVPELSGCQPFASDPHLFYHVGELAEFKAHFQRQLRDQLTDEIYGDLAGDTDSELLFATWRNALGRRTGSDAMADALEKMVAGARHIAIGRGVSASLAVVVSDGVSLVVLRAATHGTPPPLYTILVEDSGQYLPKGARVVASEPLFPGNWAPLDANSLTIFTSEETAI